MSAREGKEPTPRGDVGGTDDAGQAAEAARHIPRGTDEHADHATEGRSEPADDTSASRAREQRDAETAPPDQSQADGVAR